VAEEGFAGSWPGGEWHRRRLRGGLARNTHDEPLEPFIWEPAENTLTEVRRLSGHPPEDRCQTFSAEAFFGELAEVEGFPELYETLKETLTDLQVSRCGAANLTLYVVGRDAHGRLAGFKIRAVET
jgi:Nuclease A inhibitor-like protein